MGGDKAPEAILRGALRAVEKHGVAPERVLLVGREDALAPGLAALGGNPGFALQFATQVVGMEESPSSALRAKPDSSIAVGIAAVKQGAAGAFVSMGNTGAVVGAATLGLGMLAGVRRPGIAVTLDLTGKPVTLLDMGANIAAKPQHLCQYGVMGAALLHNVMKVAEPRVALLNIGEEATKGTDLLKEAHALLAEAPVNFVGNIESNEIFESKADVVVTDGFTGNVVLKLLEGFAGFMLRLVLGELAGHKVTWAPEMLEHLKRKIDYAEYGGALLLGVDGIVVKGHGRSGAEAVANAIDLAARALDGGVNQSIVAGIARELEDA